MKILYGVAGEGMGHAVRSKAVISELVKNHDVLVVCGSRAYKFLRKFFKTSHIHCFNIVYRNNSVSNFLTFLTNLFKFPLMLVYNLKLFNIVSRFKPDVVISDFEPFTNYVALLSRKKCINIDNQHLIINADHKCKGHFFDELTARLVINAIAPRADYCLATTFFYPKVKGKKTFLFPPILRKEILNVKAREGRHILVYQTSMTHKTLIPVLKQINEKFIVYGLNKEEKLGNIILKKFDEKEFVNDIATCKAVIANGGFSVMCEAIHLAKPFLCIPVRKQFEQILNGIYLQKLGYGLYRKFLTKAVVIEFLNRLEFYKKNLRNYKKEDNSKFFSKLEEVIRK